MTSDIKKCEMKVLEIWNSMDIFGLGDGLREVDDDDFVNKMSDDHNI